MLRERSRATYGVMSLPEFMKVANWWRRELVNISSEFEFDLEFASEQIETRNQTRNF